MIKTRVMPPTLTWDWTTDAPATQGWRVDERGGLLVIGAQYAVDDHGDVIGEGDIELQTEVVFERLEAVLHGAGADWEHVVRINTFYLFDGPDSELSPYWEKMTAVRDRYAKNEGGHSGTGVVVAGLPGPGLLITASAIAMLPTP